MSDATLGRGRPPSDSRWRTRRFGWKLLTMASACQPRIIMVSGCDPCASGPAAGRGTRVVTSLPLPEERSAMESLRVLIADDHPVFCKDLRALLTTLPEVEIVGEAGSGDEAVTLDGYLQPGIVLMDLQMPGGSGIAATRT